MRGWTPLFLSPEQPCHSSPSQPWAGGGRFTSNKRLWRAVCLSGADGRHSWDVLRQLSTSILQMLLEGEVEMLQPLETQTLCGSVCVFAIKIGAWLLAYMGTIMSWKKIKPQPWLTWCSPALNQNYCSPLRISLMDTASSRRHDLRLAQLRFAVNKDQMFVQLCFWLRPVKK